MKKLHVFLIVFTCFHFSLKSQDSLSFSFYLDTYYSYDFSDPDGNQRQYVTQVGRHNEFNVNLAMLKTSYQSDILRGNLAFQTGTYPLLNYAEPTVLGQLLNEANVGVKVGKNSWVDVGIMGGHFGYESALSIRNELYSQALATEYTPYYQMGVQYSTQFSEKLSFRAVVINGWQNIYETNDAKAVGVAVDYVLNDQISLGYGNFMGREPAGGDDEFRFHNNFVATYEKDEFNGAASIDITFQETGNINTSAFFLTLIGQYRLREKTSVSGRYEFVSDDRNILIPAAGSFQTHIITSSYNYFIRENIVFRVEGKLYFGNQAIWNGDGSTFNNQVISTGLAILLD